jgi:hypothetical protein
MDKRVNNKGTKGNKGGRPSKAQEQKANYIFTTALKRIYNEEEDDEAKIKFVQELSESQRGQIFIAEHLFGKAPQTLDVNTNDTGSVPIDRFLKGNKTE